MPAQTSGELFRTIAALDTEVFEAYNNCNLEKFRSFFVDGLEFYHDLGGLTVGGDKVTEQVKNNICGKVRRELVAGTLQVYPMQGYGALETGSHRFFPAAKGSESSGIAKFIHLWEKKDGVWKITRVISYDHKSQQK
ncbi:MAG: nuclear transport factor 2 family protein [Bryobacteraceae bacterium]|nr:nuclear transport factor 2 family protein [Bryobacteraceae bacterium]